MKPTLYILKLINGQYYIGSTPDFDRRLFEHQNGKVISTKGKRPIEVVFQKEFIEIKKARQVEYKLKSFKNKKIIEQIIEDQEIRFYQS